MKAYSLSFALHLHLFDLFRLFPPDFNKLAQNLQHASTLIFQQRTKKLFMACQKHLRTCNEEISFPPFPLYPSSDCTQQG